jgi:hypothetical protein
MQQQMFAQTVYPVPLAIQLILHFVIPAKSEHFKLPQVLQAALSVE